MTEQIIPLYKPPIKLDIKLENMPHGVYRKILVNENINLMQLHAVIQLAMGWQFSHLFQFMDKKDKPTLIASYGLIDEYEDLPEYEIDAHRIGLKKHFIELLQRKSFWYWYDFGDDWWHKISVLKPTKNDLAQYKGVPVCVDAFGKCPPEDVGGAWGYQNFCEIINNKKNPEYKEHREWLGMDLKSTYDYEHVEIQEINEAIEEYFHSKFWKRNTRDSFQEGWY